MVGLSFPKRDKRNLRPLHSSVNLFLRRDTSSFVFNPRQSLRLSGGTHPIVYVGAGSHGAYPTGGEYAAWEFAPLGVPLLSTPERMTHTGLVLTTEASSNSTLVEGYRLVLLPEPDPNGDNMGLSADQSWLGADVLWGTPQVGGRGNTRSPRGPFHKGWEKLGFFQTSATGPSSPVLRDRIFHSLIPYSSYHHWAVGGLETWNLSESSSDDIVALSGDIVVLPGATLTIEPSGVVEFQAEEDRHQFSDPDGRISSDPDRVEIFVYGTLNASDEDNPVQFRKKSTTSWSGTYAWGGIRIMPGGSADLEHAQIRDMSPPPLPPTDVTAEAGNGQVTLRWTDPVVEDPTITGWQYLRQQGNGTAGGWSTGTWRPISSVGSLRPRVHLWITAYSTDSRCGRSTTRGRDRLRRAW